MAIPDTRLLIVRSLLNNLIGTRNPRHSGTIANGPQTLLRRFWDLPRDDFVNASVYSQRVIVPGDPNQSALIKALKGDPPFDGAFDRMPPGGPYLSEADIEFIAQWIRDGAPDASPSESGSQTSLDAFFNAAPGESCRLLPRTVDGTQAEAIVVPGIVNDTYFLIVRGKKLYLNMRVSLSPRTYVQIPEYWGIEVLGCVSGIVLPTLGAYEEFLPLAGVRGTKGIEVVWSGDETKTIKVPSSG